MNLGPINKKVYSHKFDAYTFVFLAGKAFKYQEQNHFFEDGTIMPKYQRLEDYSYHAESRKFKG